MLGYFFYSKSQGTNLETMVKLTPELVENSRQHINAVQDRELDLRGYKIPAVENLGATYVRRIE